jgi:hypothetical protein
MTAEWTPFGPEATEDRTRTLEILAYVLSTLPPEQLVSLVKNAPNSAISDGLLYVWLNRQLSELGPLPSTSTSRQLSDLWKD